MLNTTFYHGTDAFICQPRLSSGARILELIQNQAISTTFESSIRGVYENAIRDFNPADFPMCSLDSRISSIAPSNRSTLITESCRKRRFSSIYDLDNRNKTLLTHSMESHEVDLFRILTNNHAGILANHLTTHSFQDMSRAAHWFNLFERLNGLFVEAHLFRIMADFCPETRTENHGIEITQFLNRLGVRSIFSTTDSLSCKIFLQDSHQKTLLQLACEKKIERLFHSLVQHNAGIHPQFLSDASFKTMYKKYQVINFSLPLARKGLPLELCRKVSEFLFLPSEAYLGAQIFSFLGILGRGSNPIISAYEQGNQSMLTLLMNLAPSVWISDLEIKFMRCEALFEAIKKGPNFFDKITQIISFDTRFLSLKNFAGHRLIESAVHYENFHAFDYLIGMGANLNELDEKGNSLFSVAANNNSFHMLQMLLTQMDRDLLYVRNQDGETPFFMACKKNIGSVADEILKNGYDNRFALDFLTAACHSNLYFAITYIFGRLTCEDKAILRMNHGAFLKGIATSRNDPKLLAILDQHLS